MRLIRRFKPLLYTCTCISSGTLSFPFFFKYKNCCHTLIHLRPLNSHSILFTLRKFFGVVSTFQRNLYFITEADIIWLYLTKHLRSRPSFFQMLSIICRICSVSMSCRRSKTTQIMNVETVTHLYQQNLQFLKDQALLLKLFIAVNYCKHSTLAV